MEKTAAEGDAKVPGLWALSRSALQCRAAVGGHRIRRTFDGGHGNSATSTDACIEIAAGFVSPLLQPSFALSLDDADSMPIGWMRTPDDVGGVDTGHASRKPIPAFRAFDGGDRVTEKAPLIPRSGRKNLKQLSLELILVPEEDGPSSRWIAGQLVELGGRLVSWQPESGRYPARAVFQFATAEDRERFAKAARHIPGVTTRNS